MNKETWKPGEAAWFEYHCYEGHDSSDAQLWYRSHQLTEIVGPDLENEAWGWESTMDERADEGFPRTYRIRFPDGHIGCAWEDELFTDRSDFYRPDPPSGPHWLARENVS